jgi:hypothetical protein
MADTNGKVYVFNVFSESINPFSTNGLSAGTIAGWESGGDTPFAPGQLAVNRVLNASDAPGNFANGKNQVLLRWPSGLHHFEMTIDGSEFPITQDLLLYIGRNQWTLYNEFGVVRAEGQVGTGPAFGATPNDFKPRRSSGKGRR